MIMKTKSIRQHPNQYHDVGSSELVRSVQTVVEAESKVTHVQCNEHCTVVVPQTCTVLDNILYTILSLYIIKTHTLYYLNIIQPKQCEVHSTLYNASHQVD